MQYSALLLVLFLSVGVFAQSCSLEPATYECEEIVQSPVIGFITYSAGDKYLIQYEDTNDGETCGLSGVYSFDGVTISYTQNLCHGNCAAIFQNFVCPASFTNSDVEFSSDCTSFTSGNPFTNDFTCSLNVYYYVSPSTASSLTVGIVFLVGVLFALF